MSRNTVDASVNRRAWEHIAAAYPADLSPQVPVGRIEWTPYPGHGPGTELLGELSGTSVIELGCGTGDNLAHAAAAGAAVAVGVDIAAGRIAQARARWGHLPGTHWQIGDAAEALTAGSEAFDVCFSVFGALWYTDPAELLPPICSRLRPGGVLAFSTAVPLPGRLPGRRADNLTLHGGLRLPVIQYAYGLAWWRTLLDGHGFTIGTACEIPPPGDGTHRTLITAARHR